MKKGVKEKFDFVSSDWIKNFNPKQAIHVKSQDGNVFEITGVPGNVSINGIILTAMDWEIANKGEDLALKHANGTNVWIKSNHVTPDKFISSVTLDGKKLFGKGYQTYTYLISEVKVSLVMNTLMILCLLI